MRISTVLLAILMLTVPAAAQAATPRALPPVERELTADGSADLTCATRLFDADRDGIARTAWRAPMSGYVNVRTDGSDGSDWDLAVFDAASGRRMGASQGFGSGELVQGWVASGQELAIQGCRRSGDDRAALEIQLVDLEPPKTLGTPSLVRVKLGDEEDLHRLEEAGLDVTHNVKEGSADLVLNTVADRKALSATGLDFTTRIEDFAKNYHRSRGADMAYAQRLAGESNLPSGNRTTYRELIDYETELKQLVADFPGHVKPVTLPQQTVEGRTIEGVEIASDVNAPEDGRPVYFVVGVHHAREWPAGEAAMEFAHLLANEFGNDARITGLLEDVRVVIVPVLNKDGFHASREAGKTYSPRDNCDRQTNYSANCDWFETVEGVPTGGQAAYRRKNCRGIAFPVGTPCELQNGVDPNRNYGEGWGGIGASMNPYAQTYRGTGPWSEPETQAVHEYTRERQVTNLITIHNVAALVLRPPGRSADGLAPDEPRMKELGDAMAEAAGYVSQYGWQLYDTSGTTEDWNYAAAGTFGYTIEMGPTDGWFHMAYETGVVDEWTGASTGKGGLREALLLSLESAANPADHSVIEGSAPAGRVLRIEKRFQTMTSPVCHVALDEPAVDQCQAEGDPIAIDDHIRSEMVVPDSGRFEWHVTPSTRPFVGARRDEHVEVTRTQTFTPEEGETSEQSGSRLLFDDAGGDSETTRTFQVTEEDKADQLQVELTADRSGGAHEYGNVEDYDVYLYYKNGEELEPIGTPRSDVPPGGALIWVLGDGEGARIGPGQPEQLIVADPPVGEYVARIVNRMGTGDSWTLTTQTISREQTLVETGEKEAWTVSCESPDGQTVYETHDVVIARGERLALDMACGGGSGGPGKPGKPDKPGKPEKPGKPAR